MSVGEGVVVVTFVVVDVNDVDDVVVPMTEHGVEHVPGNEITMFAVPAVVRGKMFPMSAFVLHGVPSVPGMPPATSVGVQMSYGLTSRNTCIAVRAVAFVRRVMMI